jgi:hypothetical protein
MTVDAEQPPKWRWRRWLGKRTVIVDGPANLPGGHVLAELRQSHDKRLEVLGRALTARGLEFLAVVAVDVIVFDESPAPSRNEGIVLLPAYMADVSSTFVGQAGRQLASWFVDYSLLRHGSSDARSALRARNAICNRVVNSLLERLDGRARPKNNDDLDELTVSVGGSKVVRDLLTLTEVGSAKYSAYVDGLGLGQS